MRTLADEQIAQLDPYLDRERAAREAARVCRPGGLVLDHEFVWRSPPPPEARRVFEGEVCPGIRFDSVEDWVELYARAGLGARSGRPRGRSR